jgi:HAD superfamily hydrolase (TIGR01509 family)
MIKLVIFDLDGVLIDTRNLHFEVLNQALAEVDKKYVISHNDHLMKFDGLSTYKKLEILTKERGLERELHSAIWNRKQELTIPELKKTIVRDEKIIKIIVQLINDGINVYVASNSIEDTVNVSCVMLGIYKLLDGILSNEDVRNPKPHPEIYYKAMIQESVLPSETLIIEDSYVGRLAAISSGANLCPVRNPSEVTIERIYKHIGRDVKDIKWTDEKMNVLIPMAGAGSRFTQARYTFPKPLIEVNGKPMIQVVIENLNIDANFIYLVRKEDFEKYNLQSLLNILTPGCKIIQVDKITEGAACTTLLAEHLIDNDNPLLIANSDQFVEWKSGEFYHSLNTNNIDGSILTFENSHPKWSYVKTDDYGNVTELKEKEVISNQATVGIYYWAKGSEYVRCAKQMIEKNIRVNGEFYVAPVYNEAILEGKIIETFEVSKMSGLGTPEDLQTFLKK